MRGSFETLVAAERLSRTCSAVQKCLRGVAGFCWAACAFPAPLPPLPPDQQTGPSLLEREGVLTCSWAVCPPEAVSPAHSAPHYHRSDGFDCCPKSARCNILERECIRHYVRLSGPYIKFRYGLWLGRPCTIMQGLGTSTKHEADPSYVEFLSVTRRAVKEAIWEHLL